MSSFARDTGALSAFRLESCIHCGICADACHYYMRPKTRSHPIWKVEPFKQAYKREASAFAPLFRLLGLKREVRPINSRSGNTCCSIVANMCGRCSLICPMASTWLR